MNENGDSFGKFCGNKTGQAVLVNGNLVVLRFRPGLYAIHGQFRLLFTPVYRKYNNDIQLKLKKVYTSVLYTRNFIPGEGKIHLHVYLLTQRSQQAIQILHKYLPHMGEILKGEWLNLRQLFTH